MDYSLIVNKNNLLNATFVPDNLKEYSEYNGIKIDPNHKTLVEEETLNSFFEMKKAAIQNGYNIVIDSAYRSYEYQQTVLNKYLELKGEEAYSFVALPGSSEHQTGLAIDIALSRNGEYIDEFDDTFPEIAWVHQNAYKFGFILRYPKGKEEITGFKYEPWHFRFVGKKLAYQMHCEDIGSLEEYHLLKKKEVKKISQTK